MLDKSCFSRRPVEVVESGTTARGTDAKERSRPGTLNGPGAATGKQDTENRPNRIIRSNEQCIGYHFPRRDMAECHADHSGVQARWSA